MAISINNELLFTFLLVDLYHLKMGTILLLILTLLNLQLIPSSVEHVG